MNNTRALLKLLTNDVKNKTMMMKEEDNFFTPEWIFGCFEGHEDLKHDQTDQQITTQDVH